MGQVTPPSRTAHTSNAPGWQVMRTIWCLSSRGRCCRAGDASPLKPTCGDKGRAETRCSHYPAVAILKAL